MTGDWFYITNVMKHWRKATDGGFEPASVCDIREDKWFGHGSPEEREFLAGLKKCRVCNQKKGPQ